MDAQSYVVPSQHQLGSSGPYAVTISHQLGSGGSYLGESLARRLAIPFVDRDILKEVAHQLNLAEAELEEREERLSTFWENFTRMAVYSNPTANLGEVRYVPTDNELFEAECATISSIAARTSAVFFGRCAQHVLREHPRRVSILVTADLPARTHRLQELYRLTEAQAADLIKTNDQEREQYFHAFTHHNWLDARLYDLCLNTAAVGWEASVDVAEKIVRARLKV